MTKVLVIDDDLDICSLLSDFLSSENLDVETAFNGESAIKKLTKTDFDVVLCDFRLPDFNGLEMLDKIKAVRSQTQVIIITGYSDVKIAVKAMRLGVFEYVTKPILPEEILYSIKQAAEAKEKPEAKKSHSKSKQKPQKEFTYIEGDSPRSTQLLKLIDLVAPTEMTCLILGESGTGKEYVAKKLHLNSNRSNKPFVALDCGSIPSELASSELFGHMKGSFTGAIQDKKGHFELANKGTLFLDEVGNLSYDNQVKLLRVLQERVVHRVGGSKDIPVDVRIVAATNEDLQTAVREGGFREDLYHRLNEFKLKIAPLRQRKEDIPLFAAHFLAIANEKLNKSIKGFSKDALELLKSHYWSGNLRELQNVVRRAALMESEDEIQSQNLPAELGMLGAQTSDNPLEQGDLNLKAIVAHAETKAIEKALELSNGNKSKTAKLLGVDRKTLYNKLSQYNIQH